MLKEAMWFAAGYAAWPAFEYAFHRWVFHNPNEETTGVNEHTYHHRDPASYNDLTWGEALMELKDLVPKVSIGLTAGLSVAIGPKRAVPLMAGLMTHWVFYERIHLVSHADEELPADQHQQYLYRHHMIHHFKNPKANYGFSTDFWDKVFGTHEVLEEDMAVPVNMAPKWLKEDLPGYKLVGKRKMAS